MTKTEKIELDREELQYFLALMQQERKELMSWYGYEPSNRRERLEDNKMISDKIQSIINEVEVV